MSAILFILYVVLILGPIYLIWAILRINYRAQKVQWMTSQEYSVFRIDVPRMNDKSPLAAEQMFATIHGIYSESAKYQYHLSFEIVAKEKYIQFFVYLPSHLKDFVQGQVYAQYPNVEIHEVQDYARREEATNKNYAIAEFNMTKPDVYPIKQFTDFEVDPISAITSVMSQVNSGEEVWFQMIIRPKGDKWQEKGHARVNSVRSGTKPTVSGVKGLILRELASLGKGFVNQAIRPGYEADDKKEIKLPASVEEALKSIEQKITKLGFETKIRVLALGDDITSAKAKCQNVCAAFKQFNTTNLNGFKIGEISVNNETLLNDFIYRSFEDDGNIFNIAELASIYHFPSATVATPNIVWSGSKKGEPPANLPIRSNTPDEDFTVLGQTNFRNIFTEFGIKRDDRRRHIYIVGKSGVGKSVLIENMAINDVYKGAGVIIVDPHGELAEKVLSCIPEERVNDVVVFDPSDREFPISFNILESVDDDFKSLVASGFIGIFKKIFGNSWGPRLEHILRNTVLALLDNPDSTMLDIPRMLTNSRFRDKVLLNVKDPVIKEFWLNEFASFDSKFRTEAVAPILNKVGQFLASSTIRNIVGQPKSTINIREIMDQEKIMIVNLSRGKIGEDNSALLGAMMITKIQLAAMSRANVTIDERPDCFLYVDEFQNFATDAFAVILSEARKYNLGLTMAHQYITQLPEELRNAIFGNAGTLISFRVGGADADVLVKEYEPVFAANDLVNLEKYNIYIKLLVDGIAAPAFSAKTLPPVQKLTGNLDKVINRSHDIYSSKRVEVENAINHRSTEEEHELKAEAEAFKKGGLEAILLKKGQPFIGSHHDQVGLEQKPIAKPVEIEDRKIELPQIEIPNTLDKKEEPIELQPTNTDNHDGAEDLLKKEPREPKVIKYQNILYGKVYKERTARGGVKWYLGEDIDEEKLAKSGTIIDDDGRKLIDLSLKVPAPDKAPKKHHEQDEDGGGVKVESDGETKAESDHEFHHAPEAEQSQNQDETHREKDPHDSVVELAEPVALVEASSSIIKSIPKEPVVIKQPDQTVATKSDQNMMEEGKAVKISD